MYETSYDILQPYFGVRKLHSQYLDTDSFKLSVNKKDYIKDLIILESTFDFSYLDKNHDLFSKKRTKMWANSN